MEATHNKEVTSSAISIAKPISCTSVLRIAVSSGYDEDADLNGDGRMEIVVYSYYYEGSFTTAYTLKDGKVKAVLDAGCGS